jgi:transposase
MSALATHAPASRRAPRAAAQRATKAADAARPQIDFLNLEGWRTYNIALTGKGEYAVYAELLTRLDECPECGAKSPEFKRNGLKRQSVRDVPHDGKPVLIRFMRQRYLCLKCGKCSQQPLAGVGRGRKLTQRLIAQTEKESFDLYSTFKAVGRRLGVSERTVRNVFTERAVALERTAKFETPGRIGVDGVYVNRKQRCIVTDLTTGGLSKSSPGVSTKRSSNS